MEKFDKLETTNSVDNIKPESEIKPINLEDYKKILNEIKKQEKFEDPDKNNADADLKAALEWAEKNNTKILGDTLEHSMAITNRWWNLYNLSPVQRIPPPPENMEIPQ